MQPIDFKDICESLTQESQNFQTNDKEYLLRVQGIVKPIFDQLSPNSKETLPQQISLLNENLEKYNVRIHPEEIKIWKESGDPILMESARFLEIKENIDHHFPKDGPGCNVVIMRNSTLLAHHSTGAANLNQKEKTSITEKQHLGSVSKHFTASCVIKLANNPKSGLSLSDDIRKHFPELPPLLF